MNSTTAIAQLRKLGRQDSEPIYIRALLPKNFPLSEALKRGLAWEPELGKIVPVPVDGYLTLNGNGATFTRLKRCKESGKWIERRTYQDGPAYLEQLNQKGYGIYYSANPGGRENGEITQCPALFYECDGIGKDEQWQKVDELIRVGYEPSLIIETRNSLHVYHRTFEQDVCGWRQLQQRLIQRQDSDPSIHNENRLMRLAGFLHWKWDTETQALESFPVTLRLATGKIYSRAELDSFLPEWDSQRWSKKISSADRIETDPSLDPWDIRNLATVLDNHNPNGRRGWITCKCPAHNGQSCDSLHIEQATGAYKCHAGCDPKAVYHAALELAKSRGYQLCERQRIGRSFSQLFSLPARLKRQLEKIRKSAWGFGRKGGLQIEAQEAKTTPAIEYRSGERLDTWAEARRQGYRFILDRSATGTAKSFDAGCAAPELFGARQLIYASAEHRNPAVPTLNSWHDLEARHKGLYRDNFAKLRRADKGQPYLVPGNCGFVDTIAALRAKNIAGADTADLICKGFCPNYQICVGVSGCNFGYLHERKKTLAMPRIRAHPDSLPLDLDYDYDEVVIIWDEASELIKTHSKISVREEDLVEVIAELAMNLPESFEFLRLLLSELRKYLSGEVKQPNKFGWEDQQIRAAFAVPEGININLVAAKLQQDFSCLNPTADHGVDMADLPRQVKKKFVTSDGTTSGRVQAEMFLNFLPDLLRVLSGEVIGNLRIQNGTLTITLRDDRLAKIAEAAALNLFLDATANVEDLALKLGCDSSEILVVEQATPDTSNLEVIQVAMGRRLGIGSRRKDQEGNATFLQERIDSLDKEIRKRTPGKVGVIDFKRNAKKGEETRSWWVDSRGVNDLEDCQVLILIGTPCRNLSDLEAEFTVLHGRSPLGGSEKIKYPISINGVLPEGIQPYFEMDVSVDPDFRAFVRRKILADIHQAVGRLRASRRPREKLKVYVNGDYPLDIPVTLKRACDLTVEAADKLELAEIGIKQAVAELYGCGKKITQKAVAEIAQVSQGYISKITSRYGGWSNWLKLFQVLLEGFNSKRNIFDHTDAPSWFGREYLPLVAAENLEAPENLLEEVASAVDLFGWTGMKHVAAALPHQTAVQILSRLFPLLPYQWQRELAEAVGLKT